MTIIRRVVTGHDESGKSAVLFDDGGPNTVDIDGWPGMVLSELWVSNESPVELGDGDRSLRPVTHDPTASGTIFRVISIPPEDGVTADPDAVFGGMDSQNPPDKEDTEAHFSMHKTDSLDYVVVISGECVMGLESGEVALRAGDCLVQQGTKHAWINRSDAPCVIAVVLIDAHPAGV
jgi:mannose-6-phosphate isomerase-like protein (cupin superfamily)